MAISPWSCRIGIGYDLLGTGCAVNKSHLFGIKIFLFFIKSHLFPQYVALVFISFQQFNISTIQQFVKNKEQQIH